jgi:hypothetical protein
MSPRLRDRPSAGRRLRRVDRAETSVIEGDWPGGGGTLNHRPHAGSHSRPDALVEICVDGGLNAT